MYSLSMLVEDHSYLNVNQIIYLSLKIVATRISDVADEMKALSIKLSRKVLNHIVSRHPEVARYPHEIIMTVKDPDLVIRGLRGEFKALKFYANLSIGSKYLVVIYREQNEEKVIITAYFTSNMARVKGEIVWRKLQ